MYHFLFVCHWFGEMRHTIGNEIKATAWSLDGVTGIQKGGASGLTNFLWLNPFMDVCLEATKIILVGTKGVLHTERNTCLRTRRTQILSGCSHKPNVPQSRHQICMSWVSMGHGLWFSASQGRPWWMELLQRTARKLSQNMEYVLGVVLYFWLIFRTKDNHQLFPLQ